MAHLFEPLTLRGVTLPNRIAVSPMCMYSARDGLVGEWHLVHYGSRATGGAGMVMMEATAIHPDGRISAEDLGLWNDAQVDAVSRITRFIASQGSAPAIQLAHAGRKGGAAARPLAPSALAFDDASATPRAMEQADIDAIIGDFVAAARRALAAGFEVIEVHAAHGYLLHEFLSPLSNHRDDAYGGSFDNRTRLLRQVVEAVRAAIPDATPLLVRVSATDWVDGGWSVDETVALAAVLKTLGVDLVDTSSGGNLPSAPIPLGPGYQTAFAERIRREAGIATGAVGMITEPVQADHIIRTGQADLVFQARESLRDPYWPLHAAQALGQVAAWPRQYLRAAPAGSVAREPRNGSAEG